MLISIMYCTALAYKIEKKCTVVFHLLQRFLMCYQCVHLLLCNVSGEKIKLIPIIKIIHHTPRPSNSSSKLQKVLKKKIYITGTCMLSAPRIILSAYYTNIQ